MDPALICIDNFKLVRLNILLTASKTYPSTMVSSCLVLFLIMIMQVFGSNFTEIPVEIIRRITSWSSNPNAARIHPVTNAEYQEVCKFIGFRTLALVIYYPLNIRFGHFF